MPAYLGTYLTSLQAHRLDSRLRGNDEFFCNFLRLGIFFVIPAYFGTYLTSLQAHRLDSRLHGNDEFFCNFLRLMIFSSYPRRRVSI